MIYINKTENRITFKIKARYYLEPLTPERMKLSGSTKSKMNKNENGKNVPPLKITEVVLTHCCIFQKFYTEFSYIEVWFTDQQNSKSLEIEDKINIILVVID